MPIWNKFDAAVWTERLRLHTCNEISRATSYQGQALLELARRLELETELCTMQKDLAVALARAKAAAAQIPLWAPATATSEGVL